MRIKYGVDSANQFDVTDYVSSLVKRAEFEDGYIIGNVASYELELTFNNLSINDTPVITFSEEGYFTLLDDNGNQQGIFYVYEKPEKYTSSMKITAYDSMIKMRVPYNSKLDYKDSNVTIGQQFNEMSSITGITISQENLPDYVTGKVIKWYDNSYLITDYIGWVAEIAGMNAECNESGTVVFRGLNADPDFEINSLSDLSVLDIYQVSRVCFDNGLVSFEEGDNTYNTLYLNPNNAYIDDPGLITLIYNAYNGYQFLGVDNVKMMGNRDIRLGHRIKYLDKEFLVLNMNVTEYGGEAEPVYEISGKMEPKNDEIAINRIDAETKIRRLQVLYDQNDTAISLIAKDMSSQGEKVNSLESRLQIAEDSIASSVTKEDIEVAASEVYETKVVQTSKDITASIKTTITDPLADSVNARLEPMETWFNFSNEGLGIGKSDSKFKSVISNDKFAFKEDDEEVAYFSDRSFLVTEAEIKVKLVLGKFAFIPRANGSLDFKKVK